MCLVAFQKIFRKIFSGVWKRRRKTQIQKNTSHNLEKNRDRRRERRGRSKITIDASRDRAVDHDLAIVPSIAISDRDRRHGRWTGFVVVDRRRGLGSSSLVVDRDLDQRRDLATARSHSTLLLSCARALSLSHFPKML